MAYSIETMRDGEVIDTTTVEELCFKLGVFHHSDEVATGKALLEALVQQLKRDRMFPVYINNGTGIRYTVENLSKTGKCLERMEIGIVS